LDLIRLSKDPEVNLGVQEALERKELMPSNILLEIAIPSGEEVKTRRMMKVDMEAVLQHPRSLRLKEATGGQGDGEEAESSTEASTQVHPPLVDVEADEDSLEDIWEKQQGDDVQMIFLLISARSC
jgi:hypothetical protein